VTDATPTDVAEIYRAMFAPRYDAYADWYVDPDPNKSHWIAVRSELTPERVLEGLQTPHPVSAYMEDREGFTHVGAIDFDQETGWVLAVAVANELVAAGAFPMLERSRRGAHLWLPLDRAIAGPTVRLGLRTFVARAHPGAERDPKVEILPKHLEQRVATSVGSPLRMPMMAHPLTGRRFPLCTPNGTPLGGTISAVLVGVELTPADILVRAAASVKTPISEAHISNALRRPSQPGGDVISLLEANGAHRAAPGRTVRCPLHDDRAASLVISKDAERVWCKSPACPAWNDGRGLGADQLAKELGAMNG